MIPVQLIFALCAVESNHNPRAIGDGGKAVGVLQITPICVDDVNRICKAGVSSTPRAFTMDDRYDPDASKLMCQIYLDHYASRHSLEGMARIWNGGPNGANDLSTIPYWKKVRAVLLQLCPEGRVGEEIIGP